MKIRVVVATASFVIALACGSAFAADNGEKSGGSFSKIPTVKGIEILKPGTAAPDFTVVDLKGQTFNLKSVTDKDAVLLFFWSFFCGPCREEMPMLNQVTKDYAGKGLRVVSVNLDGKEMKKAVDKFVATEKIVFETVFDELEGDAFKVADPYGVAGTPAMFLITKNEMKIVYTKLGVVTSDALRAELNKVVKQ